MRRGFTLIELLVVISIIGFLVSSVLATVTVARTKAIDNAIKQDMNNAQAAAELFYYANDNSYGVTYDVDGNPIFLPDSRSVCRPTANVGGVKGIYNFLQAAQEAGGLGGNIMTEYVPPGGSTTYRTVACNVNLETWIAVAPLKESTAAAPLIYCVDSTGARVVKNHIPAFNAYWVNVCANY